MEPSTENFAFRSVYHTQLLECEKIYSRLLTSYPSLQSSYENNKALRLLGPSFNFPRQSRITTVMFPSFARSFVLNTSPHLHLKQKSPQEVLSRYPSDLQLNRNKWQTSWDSDDNSDCSAERDEETGKVRIRQKLDPRRLCKYLNSRGKGDPRENGESSKSARFHVTWRDCHNNVISSQSIKRPNTFQNLRPLTRGTSIRLGIESPLRSDGQKFIESSKTPLTMDKISAEAFSKQEINETSPSNDQEAVKWEGTRKSVHRRATSTKTHILKAHQSNSHEGIKKIEKWMDSSME